MHRTRAIGLAAAAVVCAFICARQTSFAQAPAGGADAPDEGATDRSLEVTILVDDEGGKKPVTIVPSGARVTVAVRVLKPDGSLDTAAEGDVAVAGLALADGERADTPPILKLTKGEARRDAVYATGETIAGSWKGGAKGEPEVRVFTGWLCLAPPLIALVLAIATRAVLPSLLAGIWIGATVILGDPVFGLLRTLDTHIIEAVKDDGHAKIIVFTIFLGGMTAVIARSGGTHGVVDRIAPIATTPRRGLLATWALGIAVFFDDYANTLIVGPTMRPVTDRLKVSREKLAYVVDSTAAPIAALALVSTWIGTELAYIKDGYAGLGLTEDPYKVFVWALPGRFYSLMAILLVAMTIILRRDIGPMARAEARAARGEGVLGPGAKPAAGAEIETLEPPAGKPRRALNAVLPILTVVLVTLIGLAYTGTDALSADRTAAAAAVEAAEQALAAAPGSAEAQAALEVAKDAESKLYALSKVVGSSDSYLALIWASFLGAFLAIVLAVGQRILSLAEATDAFVTGAKAMIPAIAILVLAWALGSVCGSLLTGNYVASMLQGNLPIALLPAITFIACAGIAFATGTSWGTMGLMLPLSIAVAGGLLKAALPEGQALDPYSPILLGTIVAVLDGAIFGDHCSPISDTTVLSSMASSCDHIDHVRTQLPYALIGAGAALVLGYLPYGFGLPAPIGLMFGLVAIAGVLRTFGRARPDQPDPPAPAADAVAPAPAAAA